MKKIYSIPIIMILALILIATSNPSLSFAKEKEDYRNYNGNDHKNLETKEDDSFGSSYWPENVRDWLESRASVANAQTSDDNNNDSNDEDNGTQNRMPVISSIKSPTVLSVNQTGTWTIKAFDPENEPLEYSVDWGDNLQAIAAKMSTPIFTQTSTFTHTYVTPGTYTIKFTVRDESENTTESTVTVYVKADTSQVPVISEVSATSTSKNKVVVSWNTDIKSNSMVWISETSPVNTTGRPTISRPDKVLSHKVKIGNLDENTTYYVVVGSRTGPSGKVTISSESSFTTRSSEQNKPPMISDLAGPQNLLTDQVGTWTLKAFDPESKPLEYSVDWGDVQTVANRMSKQVFTQTSTFTHAYITPGTYNIKFTVKDELGLQYSTTTNVIVTLAPDTDPPTITNINQTTISTSTIITWDTNENSTSKVFYSTISPLDVEASTTMSVASDVLVKSHMLQIGNLSTSTIYYLKVRSVDAAGNTATSSEFTVTTTSGL